MKILLVNWQDPSNPQAGGAEIHLLEIFRRIRAQGHQVTWLASGWSGAETAADLEGISIRRVGSRYSFGIAAAQHLRRHVREGDFDVVVEALNKVPIYAPLWVRTPTVLLVHHLFGTTAFQQASLPLATATWLQERPIPAVYRGIPVQAISRSTADDLIARGLSGSDIRVIYPGVDGGFFSPDPALRAPTPTFLYVGRLQKYKRVDLVLQALAELVGVVPDVSLVIAGRGERRQALEREAVRLKIQGNVRFAGFVTEEEKRDLFRAAWAHTLTSPKEGWGITNLEAAGCGTATIASDAPGLRESVAHDRTGWLVPHGDVRALSRAMRELAEDRTRVETFGKNAREFALGFTWEKAAAETLAHLTEVAARQTSV